MLSKIKLTEWLNSARDSIQEQEWYQQLKAKWEELDTQSRTYLKFASFGAGILISIFITLSFIWKVHSLKRELSEKRTLLTTIQTASDEVRRLKEVIPGNIGESINQSEADPWTHYFNNTASTIGLDKASLSISPEQPGASTDQAKEVLYDVKLQHVNIKQIIRYIVSLENGRRPVKIRNLQIETKSDPSGYLDANLALSGFTLVEPK